ncbi:hypothetical protein [Brumimicrobium oceani]|uniref:DUF4783 domain-containing protein n=1 Tax=Brumimicrobium oceani TaxID=2100725 RepID=A0A2U2XCA9_9FLAO|nr:hypothetical protein [Brumimicrobium oceani]PWH85434.1 hypothetical protein DIT68_09255 [Brumimicrobium oceani]
MKKLILLFAIMIFTGVGFAQTAYVEGTAATLKENLDKNFVTFKMPSEVTSEVVDKSAQYYTDYFTVDFSPESKLAKINILPQADQPRRVISRFLLSTGVRTVNFEGKDFTIMEFYANYLE